MQQCMIHGSLFIEIERIHALAPIFEIKNIYRLIKIIYNIPKR